jgi:hypothetical protein
MLPSFHCLQLTERNRHTSLVDVSGDTLVENEKEA